MNLPRLSSRALRGLAIALLVANIGIVVTGGAVRLTGSGLGCPTWPQCTEDSFVPHGELGLHGFIEFGNRLLTFVLAAIALATWAGVLLARPRRRAASWLALVIGLGIPLQAVIGGISVRTGLNPWVVNLHLMLSIALIALSVVLVRRLDEIDEPALATVPGPVRLLTRVMFVTALAVVYLGTMVTGSGPYAGDADAPRNGLDPERLSQLHADLVFLLVGLTIGTLLAFRATGAPNRAERAVATLLGVELAQGAIGFTQYFLGLPLLLVGLHLLGAALIAASATWTLLGTRQRTLIRDFTPRNVGQTRPSDGFTPKTVVSTPHMSDSPESE